MDVILLRKMARKSVFNFGKHELKTVQQVIDIQPEYIGYVYYKVRQISFTDDILNELEIKDDYRIEKPSNNYDTDLFDRWKRHYRLSVAIKASNEKNGLEKEQAFYRSLNRNRNKRIGDYKAHLQNEHHKDALLYSKTKLQGVNQGKICRY